MSASFLDELNGMQYEAVVYSDSPSLVIAGAGSGKTRVLTSKIAYLISQGVAPWSILALTFTNKAAHEMKERIAKLIGDDAARYVWMGTFHSIFAHILRKESAHIGFDSHFTIYDQSDSRSLLRNIIKNMSLDDKTYKVNRVESCISAAKNRLITADDYLRDDILAQSDKMNGMPMIGNIYKAYETRCAQSNAMDFDDLLMRTYYLFKEQPNVCQAYAERFGHILVDEYQDTNYVQHCIITQLSSDNKDLCVVGDDAQSIYSFRGAEIDNILQFQKVYPSARLFKLEQNYRSTQTIVCAANSVIRHNKYQIPKDVFSKNEKGAPIRVIEAYSDIEEAEIVRRKISKLCATGQTAYGQIAILYRTNAQSRVFEESFRKNSIPYRIVGGLSFYQRKEIKDIMAYFRLTVNPQDEEALRRIINYPMRGIGDTTLKKLMLAANLGGTNMWNIISQIECTDAVSLNKGTRTKIAKFRELIESFQQKAEKEDAYELATDIIRESGIQNDINSDLSPENTSRRENVMELLNAIKTFVDGLMEQEGTEWVSLLDYLAQASLMTDITDLQEKANNNEDDANKVTLMTIHAAKGLEFKGVFIVGVETDLFPGTAATYSPREMEEERRLFYVALTRAKEFCFLSYARSRFRYGSTTFPEPSCFLRDIDPQYLDSIETHSPQNQARTPNRTGFWENNTFSTYESKKNNLTHIATREPTDTSEVVQQTTLGNGNTFTVGQCVEHPRFGLGEITQIESAGDSSKLTIRFDNSGEKKLLLKFAKLKIVE